MGAIVEREVEGMKGITIQEKDLTLRWRGNTGKPVKVRLRNTRVVEMWHNKQTTEENIQEITTLNITKNGRSLVLEIYPERSIYVEPNLDRINVPVFFIRTPTNRGTLEEIFSETLES